MAVCVVRRYKTGALPHEFSMLEPRLLLFVSLLGLLVDEPKTRFDALLTLTPVMPPTRGNVFADDHSVPAANLRAARQRSLYHALHVLELFPTKFGQQRARLNLARPYR